MTGTVAIECPRCGYDLRGVVASWREQCPSTGSCAECGLSFEWREVLHPSHRVPDWSVEAKRPVLDRPRQLGTALLHVFRPQRYWSGIVMTHPIRWDRLARFTALVTLLVVGGLFVLGASIAAIDHLDNTTWGATSPDGVGIVFGRMLWSPLSSAPVSGYTWRRPGGPALTTAGPGRVWYTGHVWSMALPFLMLTFLGMLVSALAFAALPQSRRRAKVRARHIVRVALHGLLVPVAVLAITAGFLLFRRPGQTPEPWLSGTTLVLMTVATFAWWQAATRCYLRMEHSWAVAAATTVIGLLTPIVAYCVAKYGM